MNNKQLVSVVCIVASLSIIVYVKLTSPSSPSDVADLVDSIKDGDVGTSDIIDSFSGNSDYDLSNLSFSRDGLDISDEFLYNIQLTIDLVNTKRTAQGFTAFTADTAMVKAANIRAEEIATAYDSIRPDGNVNESIMSELNIHYVNFNEVIDSGSTSPSSVVNVWSGSADVNNNIMSPIYTRIGVGIYVDNEGTYYWSLILAN